MAQLHTFLRRERHMRTDFKDLKGPCVTHHSPGGRALARFWYMASVRKGVKGAMTCEHDECTNMVRSQAMHTTAIGHTHDPATIVISHV